MIRPGFVSLIGRTQLLLPPTLNLAFRSFEPWIGELFPNEQLLKKKKIAATKWTIFHWETAVRFTVQKIWMPGSMSGAKVTEYVLCVSGCLWEKYGDLGANLWNCVAVSLFKAPRDELTCYYSNPPNKHKWQLFPFNLYHPKLSS